MEITRRDFIRSPFHLGGSLFFSRFPLQAEEKKQERWQSAFLAAPRAVRGDLFLQPSFYPLDDPPHCWPLYPKITSRLSSPLTV